MDLVKEQAAKAALNSAVNGVRMSLTDYDVEAIEVSPLIRQVRVRKRGEEGQGPRYFQIQFSEPI